MNFQELLHTQDKKFYKISEIEKIAKQEAQDHICERSKISKLTHKLGSQQTAIDVFRDLQDDLDLSLKEKDRLARIASIVRILITVRKCDLIVSVNTKKYKNTFHRFQKIYFQEVQEFVNEQFTQSFASILLHHLKDALEVLREKGDIKAEKRISELPLYQELISHYLSLKDNIKDLHKDFKISKFQDAKTSLKYLQEHEIAQPAVKELKKSLQELFDLVIRKVVDDIKKAQSVLLPSILEIVEKIDYYLNIRDLFQDMCLNLGADEYSHTKIDLQSFLIDFEEKLAEIQSKQSLLPDDNEPSIEKLISYMSINEGINDFLAEIRIPYLEIEDQVSELKDKQASIIDEINKIKVEYLSELRLKFIRNQSLNFEEQLILWQKVQMNMTKDLENLHKKNLQFPELEHQEKLFPSVRDRYVRMDLKSFSPQDKILNDFKEYCQMLCDYLPETEIEKLKIRDYFPEIEYYQKISPIAYEKLLILDQMIGADKDPMPYQDDIKLISTLANAENTGFYFSFDDTRDTGAMLGELYPLLYEWLRDYYQDKYWSGNLILQAPNANAKVVLLSEPILKIGRGSKKGDIIKDNMLLLPWTRISGQHVEIDFQEGTIKDLNSTNGTFINKKTDKITQALLTDITEFNLASDLTFRVFYQANSFSGILFSGFTTKFDNTLPFTSKTSLGESLMDCFFIYLPTHKKDIKLYIRKFDGRPIYGNDILDEKDCYIIQREYERLLYSDLEKGIKDLIILKTDNPNMDLNIVNFPS